MKLILFLVYLGLAIAMPSDKLAIDWTKVTPIEVFVEPIPNVNPSIGTRIVGGTEATPNSIPYQVGILNDVSGFCGGSLISREWILTAAHCTISTSYVQIILGAHNISNIEATQIVVTSRNITNHPNYDNFVTNDVALIRLPYPVNLTNAIQVVSLAPTSSGTFAGSVGLVSGWGLTSNNATTISNTLHVLNASIITNAVCSNSFGSLVINSTICTSGAGGVSVCSSDSGGPLVVGSTQVGVVSFGSGRCGDGYPSGYARVSSFRSWINSLTGI